MAGQLKLFGRKNSETDLLQVLQSWVRDESKRSWLVVLANVDDTSFVLVPPAMSDEARLTQPRIDYSLMSEHGSLTITTRSKKRR